MPLAQKSIEFVNKLRLFFDEFKEHYSDALEPVLAELEVLERTEKFKDKIPEFFNACRSKNTRMMGDLILFLYKDKKQEFSDLASHLKQLVPSENKFEKIRQKYSRNNIRKI